MQALIRAGIHLSHSPFDPDILLTSPDTRYVLDSIYFEKIEKPEQQIPPGCLGLVHHLNSLYPRSEDYFQRHEKRILERFTGFIVSSNFTFRYLTDRGFDASAIIIAEPAPSFENRRNRTPWQKVNALMLGSVVPRKGQLRFLQSLAEADIPPYYTLTIAGSTTADFAYSHQCAELILHHASLRKCVRLLGEQDPETIGKLYEGSNLFISASEMETFGMAIQDAVVCGIPVLVQEGGYAAEHVIHGHNGCRCMTMDELVDHFRKCVKDTTHFATMQKQALQFIPRYHSWDDAASHLIKAFAQ